MKYKVLKEDTLLNFLYKNVNKSKNTIKNLLKNRQVYINNKIITKFDYKLNIEDIIEIKNKIDDLEIIYEDKFIIVVNKKENTLSVSTEEQKEKTLYHMVSEYLKDKNKNSKVFIIHRLDKATSGVIMFAKTKEVQKIYQDNWSKIVKKREYKAVVEGILEKKQDTIVNYLEENKQGYVYVSKCGKKAITEYKVIKENKNYTLLDINIKTGRKNQIRATMQAINHPIVGDKKYGSKSNTIKRLALHANKLKIINPLTNKLMIFGVEYPKSFDNLLK